MIAQSEEAVLLLDDSKLGARGQNAIARVTEVSSVLAHGAPAAALEPLRATGVNSRRRFLARPLPPARPVHVEMSPVFLPERRSEAKCRTASTMSPGKIEPSACCAGGSARRARRVEGLRPRHAPRARRSPRSSRPEDAVGVDGVESRLRRPPRRRLRPGPPRPAFAGRVRGNCPRQGQPGGDRSRSPPLSCGSTLKGHCTYNQEVLGAKELIAWLRFHSSRIMSSTRRWTRCRRWKQRCRGRRRLRPRPRTRAASCSEVTSPPTATPSCSATASWAPSSSRSNATTQAPAEASVRDRATIPPAPPVTSATLPCSSSPGGGAWASL